MTPTDDTHGQDQPSIAANDNGPDPKVLRKVDDVVLRLARLIERQMAREDFAARIAAAANDNHPEPGKSNDRGEQD